MTKTKTKLKWRLAERPTPMELASLYEMKLLEKDEVREILFSTEEDKDTKELESEIKFLREIVQKLSNNSKTVEIIRTIQNPYFNYGWFTPYQTWCNSNTFTMTGTAIGSINTATSGSMNLSNTVGLASNSGVTGTPFTSIKTF